MTRLAALPVALAALAAALLAGCGGKPAPRPAYNQHDVMFLQMMTPHHRQGLAIVRLVNGRLVRPEVRRLADAIAVTQADEITRMSGWLRRWRQPATAPAEAHRAHGGMPSTTRAEITAVADTPDAGFETAFLDLLIAHQDDAIQIARLELHSGGNADVVALAHRIERSRTAQLRQLTAWRDPP